MSAGGARVLIVGAGDVGLKIARGLAETQALRHLILADLHCDHLVEPAGAKLGFDRRQVAQAVGQSGFQGAGDRSAGPHLDGHSHAFVAHEEQ